jgi:hypothetical protein
MTVACDVCGKDFEQTYRKEKRCSEQCRRKYENRKTTLKRLRRERKRRAEKNALPQTCHLCAGQFIAPKQRKFCTKECSAKSNANKAKFINQKSCKKCNETFFSEKYTICKICRLVEKKIEETGNILIELVACRECKKIFVISKGRSVFCSRDCYRKYDKRTWASRYRRRCKQYGVPYDKTLTLAAALKHFGYVCAICNELILGNQFDSTDPNQAVLDHIIPLALREQSPGHVWSNVQIVHRHCNNVKAHMADMPLITHRRKLADAFSK